jgi:hypothetical protein
MKREDVLKLLEKEWENIGESAIDHARRLADRDEKMKFLSESWGISEEEFNSKSEAWRIWFAYWLGREHGRATAIGNAIAKLKENNNNDSIIKIFLKALWVINP